eukprot:scaffold6853_cov50-Attheya_sp.AAC.2
MSDRTQNPREQGRRSSSLLRGNRKVYVLLIIFTHLLFLFLPDKFVWPKEVSNTSLIVHDADATILQAAAEQLEKSSIRFYMYDDPDITQNNTSFTTALIIWRRYHQEMENDEQMLAAIENSPLRTSNPEEAALFIPPIPFGRILTSSNNGPIFHAALNALVNHEIFRKHQGNKHVILSTAFILFRSGQIGNIPPMKHWYPKIYNMTAIQSWDPSAVYNDIHHAGGDWGDYHSELKSMTPLTRRSASVGLGNKNEVLDLTLATIEKFHNASNFVFYQSRTAPSVNNSTIFRHAPITNITQANFPKSSIGVGLEPEQWTREFKDSKFCLMIRGDSPHSHALGRSIRVGCIPVVAADVLPIYSPMFKATLNMSDYAVILSEQDLVNNAEKTLLKLNEMSDAEIELKIKHLAFAQRVIFTDHPQSLFVPAFLKEAMMATVVK